MKTILEYYDIEPKVFQVQERTRITVRSLGKHAAFGAGSLWRIRVIPMNMPSPYIHHPFSHLHPYLTAHGMDPEEKEPKETVTAEAGEMTLSFEWSFPSEQEYILEMVRETGDRKEKSGKERIIKLRVYAVEKDLFGLLPLKGNMHMHSFRSDGKEAPEIVAASYRRAGYDFIAITDHAQYQPSLEAAQAYENVPIDMQIYPGEEVHAPDNNIHIVHFAGQWSVNEKIKKDPEVYYTQSEQIRKKLGLPDQKIWFEYASSQWVFEQIRQAGGLAILAHPNWIWCDAYNIPSEVYRRFLRDGGYDALELINGGNTPEENEAQIAVWQEERAKGSQAIATGSDDSHGSINGQWFDIAKTYVLAEHNDRESILSAVRNRRCIAVLSYHGESTHYYGDARMIAYFAFLDREYFPLHDDLCIEEGRMMKEHVCGNPEAAERLKIMKGQTLSAARRAVQAKI